MGDLTFIIPVYSYNRNFFLVGCARSPPRTHRARRQVGDPNNTGLDLFRPAKRINNEPFVYYVKLFYRCRAVRLLWDTGYPGHINIVRVFPLRILIITILLSYLIWLTVKPKLRLLSAKLVDLYFINIER